MDKPPVRRARWHLWLVVLLTFTCIGVYLVLLVLPSYRSGIYRYTLAQRWGHEPSDLHIPEWMHAYWHWGGTALLVSLGVPLVLPLAIGSVLLHWRALTQRERIIWALLVIITFIIVQQTWYMAGAMTDYILD